MAILQMRGRQRKQMEHILKDPKNVKMYPFDILNIFLFFFLPIHLRMCLQLEKAKRVPCVCNTHITVLALLLLLWGSWRHSAQNINLYRGTQSLNVNFVVRSCCPGQFGLPSRFDALLP